ncbi:Lnb N-terminal periplasmic domain-containing protein [Carboxylicivirga marina]|uniref:DUF4105 domain-containing protein n=1 Tax=Carboxylicivirga marina TaxID=2800988 RepID=A0ABS1HK94_9BACT|nr:DUF4105 domain-containing protein [Carboxylicivirga marina]MBK3518091.1 DUF4105 domain-containing protein [Carboxylicivirga marina]
MRYYIAVLLFAIVPFVMNGQTKLSEEAEISLLTCEAGDELYSLFGHSAIRVNDPISGFDWVFNYGTFDFDTPNFYLKFANGNLNYMLSMGHYRTFIRNYHYEKRGVWEQKINLTPLQKQKLYSALLTNLQPENRLYRYDFLFDNCATRIRDIFEDSIDDELVYDTKSVDTYTYREMLHIYDEDKPWIADGLDLILGMKTDYDANQHNQMFLPDYLMKHLSGATKSSNSEALLGDVKTVLSFDKPADDNSITPSQFFWLLFVLSALVAYVEIKRKRPLLILNRLFFLLTGVVGCLIFFLWFLSRHSVTGENFNMLWAIPFNVFVAFFASWFYRSKPFQYYLLFLIIGATIPLLFFWLIPQYLPAMVYPLCLLLISRYATWYYLLTRR